MRTRSVSVSTEPFTHATGLPSAICDSVVGAVGTVKTVGVWEATCAPAHDTASRKFMQMGNVCFINVTRVGKKGREIIFPSPLMQTD